MAEMYGGFFTPKVVFRPPFLFSQHLESVWHHPSGCLHYACGASETLEDKATACSC